MAEKPDLPNADRPDAECSRGTVLRGLGEVGVASTWSARNEASIKCSNERANFTIAGLNSRVNAPLSALQANRNDARLIHICDIDAVLLAGFAEKPKSTVGKPAGANQDFCKTLASKDIGNATLRLLQLANLLLHAAWFPNQVQQRRNLDNPEVSRSRKDVSKSLSGRLGTKNVAPLP